jgi:hypothetical protein
MEPVTTGIAMNKTRLITALALAAALPAFAADVGVSVQISQPGVYGRIDIGRFPQPQVVVQQPVIIAQPPVVVAQPEPVYLWVPPGHRKNWRRYCGQYHACGVPVYFVEDRWYREHVRPERGPGHGDRDDHGHGHGNGKGNGKGHRD